ncbi:MULTISPECIES: hypothetical protein [Clostridium]|uniref:hypothetical protein n=1 Tax=Clostridium TaxID=1485 RepID=UPI000834B700|nr:hypothetical protein [Clostridium nigeriense]
MRLDKGKIVINNKEIYSGMDSESFKKIFLIDVNSYTNGNIERYNFKSPQIIDGLSLWVKIIFKDSFLSSIEMKNADLKLKNSYDNWSDDKVELKRESHNNWLINNLGEAHEKLPVALIYRYSWGKIESYYDPKAADSGILITYNRNNA